MTEQQRIVKITSLACHKMNSSTLFISPNVREKKGEREKNPQRARIHFYRVYRRRSTDVRNWSGHVNHINFAILPQPGCCLHKMALDSNKSWKGSLETMGREDENDEEGKETEKYNRRW